MKTLIIVTLLYLGHLSAIAQEAIWRDVPVNQLNGVAINDLQGRMRESMVYTARYGFGTGIPTFENGKKNGQIVYGTY